MVVWAAPIRRRRYQPLALKSRPCFFSHFCFRSSTPFFLAPLSFRLLLDSSSFDSRPFLSTPFSHYGRSSPPPPPRGAGRSPSTEGGNCSSRRAPVFNFIAHFQLECPTSHLLWEKARPPTPGSGCAHATEGGSSLFSLGPVFEKSRACFFSHFCPRSSTFSFFLPFSFSLWKSLLFFLGRDFMGKAHTALRGSAAPMPPKAVKSPAFFSTFLLDLPPFLSSCPFLFLFGNPSFAFYVLL